jgi:DNA-binding PadR family transcriptional regulator
VDEYSYANRRAAAMARKVSNLLGLAVLAVLAERPMHRYEMASVIRSRGKDRQLAVKWGSLYTVVDSLTRHGFVAVVGNDREGARPERTIYRITESGVAELQDWARELVSEPAGDADPFVAGLSVLAALPPEEAVVLLEKRIEALSALVEVRRDELVQESEKIARIFVIEDEYALSQLEAQLAWVRRFQDELLSGSFADLDGWRQAQTAGIPGLSATAGESAERSQRPVREEES